MATNNIKNSNQLLKFLSQVDIEDFLISSDPKKERTRINKFCNESIQDNRIVLVLKVKN